MPFMCSSVRRANSHTLGILLSTFLLSERSDEYNRLDRILVR